MLIVLWFRQGTPLATEHYFTGWHQPQSWPGIYWTTSVLCQQISIKDSYSAQCGQKSLAFNCYLLCTDYGSKSLYLIKINPCVGTCCFTELPANVTASAMQEQWGIHAKQRTQVSGKKHGVTVSKVPLVSTPGLKVRWDSSSAWQVVTFTDGKGSLTKLRKSRMLSQSPCCQGNGRKVIGIGMLLKKPERMKHQVLWPEESYPAVGFPQVAGLPHMPCGESDLMTSWQSQRPLQIIILRAVKRKEWPRISGYPRLKIFSLIQG